MLRIIIYYYNTQYFNFTVALWYFIIIFLFLQIAPLFLLPFFLFMLSKSMLHCWKSLVCHGQNDVVNII